MATRFSWVFCVIIYCGFLSTAIASNGFSGEYYNLASGTVFFRARCYDPDTGEFLTKDPLGVRGGMNSYTYCYENPVCYCDPDGTKTRLLLYTIDKGDPDLFKPSFRTALHQIKCYPER